MRRLVLKFICAFAFILLVVYLSVTLGQSKETELYKTDSLSKQNAHETKYTTQLIQRVVENNEINKDEIQKENDTPNKGEIKDNESEVKTVDSEDPRFVSTEDERKEEELMDEIKKYNIKDEKNNKKIKITKDTKVNVESVPLNNKPNVLEVQVLELEDKVFDESVITVEVYKKLKDVIKCNNKDFQSVTKMRGDYWVLQNFVKAEHGEVECFEDVTFVTQGDFTYLDNLEAVVTRWRAPVSVALHAPGSDFQRTVTTLRYMRECSPARLLIVHWVSFHLFFHKDHMPDKISYPSDFKSPFNCSGTPPYLVNSSALYKTQKSLLYPVNVARNVGRDAALTHYFLLLDVELYPIPRLGARFLNMLARNTSLISGQRPRVFVLKPFEVEAHQNIPENKTALQVMLRANTSVPFHKYVCPECHKSPFNEEWLQQPETPNMEITGVGKRTGHWEPLFISTPSLPYLEESLSWDGMRDKMSQAFVLCVLDYDFFILSNAFVTHHPGIKKYKKEEKRAKIVDKQWKYLKEVVFKELKTLYGEKKWCVI